MFKVSIAFLTFIEHSPHHHSNFLKKFRALFKTVELALHQKEIRRLLAGKEKMASEKHCRFVSSAFPCYKNVIADAQGPEGGERIIASESSTSQRKSVGKPCLE